MADEEVTPVEETVTETPEATQEELPLAATTEETAEADKPAEAAKPVEPVADPEAWKDKELKSKHRQLQDAKRERAELQAKLDTQAALLAKFNQAKPEEVQVVPADEVERRAQELNAQQRYIENCNQANSSGEKVYGDNWKSSVENLELLGGFDPGTMNGVLATDDPAKVIFELGKNPDNYHRIMALPLEKRIIEMGKLAMQPGTNKTISNAPAPVNTISGRAATPKETLRDDMEDDKWFSIRRAQRMAKFNANQVRR
jgi:hypothetical protein